MKEKNFEEINKDLEKMFYESEDGYEYLNNFLYVKRRGKIKSNRSTLDCIDKLTENHSIDRLQYLSDSISGELDRFKNVIIPECVFLLSFIIAIISFGKKFGDMWEFYAIIAAALVTLYYYGYKYYKRFEKLYAYAFYLKKALEFKKANYRT